MSHLPLHLFNEQLYNTYAAIMYGCILGIVKEKTRADEVFKNAFIDMQQLQKDAATIPQKIWVIKFAMQKALSSLKENASAHSPASVKEAFKFHTPPQMTAETG